MAKDYHLPYLDLTNLVPSQQRNPMVKSLIDNLFNRFLTQDESVPLYGYVGVKPASVDDSTPKIMQSTVERDVNSLVPVLSFTAGQETFSYTPQDLIRKAEVLGVSADQSSWLYSQGNNYCPPIDFDRFTNFFNYYWVAKALPTVPVLPWNPTAAPEYYIMARPAPADLDKLNVHVATTTTVVLTGSGYYDQTWTVTFLTPTTFMIQANGSTIGFAPGEDLQGPFILPDLPPVSAPGPYPTIIDTFQFSIASSVEPLLIFNVVRDAILDNSGGPYAYEGFEAGDAFLIDAPFLSSTYSVSFSGGPGQKGKISGVNSLDTFQTIDGRVLQVNDRVLVRHGSPSDQGIYAVQSGAWVRTADFDDSTGTAQAGARVFVVNGSQADTLWVSFASGGGFGWTSTVNTVSNTSNWQEGNYWVHRDALTGVDLTKIVQASRPIIEFSANLKLNTRVASTGLPTDTGGTLYEQVKTEFNQAPLFDLYRYDGSHAHCVSPIFFYVEDATEAIDTVLQRRVKHSSNLSGDFLFDHGLRDTAGQLFYKDTSGALHSIWHPGYSSPSVIDTVYEGVGAGTIVLGAGANAFASQQIWTLVAETPTTFSVSGSKNKTLPTPYDVLTVGTPYSNGLFNATLFAGAIPFVAGDTYQFSFGNFETTRYVYRETNNQLYDLFGGPALDSDGIGAWQTPRMFFHNFAAASGGELPEGTLYSHFRGILANQLPGAVQDNAFGGSIKLWSEQENLLAALLMQRDVTPISMIDMAQQQYQVALNSVTDIYLSNILKYFSEVEVLNRPSDTAELLDYILAIRVQDNEVRTVLYDSTSPVPGFPATLPQLGVLPLVLPGAVFDDELGATLFQHHDGHLSSFFEQTPAFRDQFLGANTTIVRSDGLVTPAVGSYTTTAPAMPYKGLLWQYPGVDTEFRVFDVVSDSFIAPAAAGLVTGDYWYNRGVNILYRWAGAWVVEPNMLAPWVTINIAELLNDLIEAVETRLYYGISSAQRQYFSASDVKTAVNGPLGTQLQRELATWAAQNQFDPLAPDFVSTDAFTWNYSSSTLMAAMTPPFPARWFDVLRAHQATFGALVIPTARPNLEPWKLLGNPTKPSTWDTTWKNPVTPSDVAADASYANSWNVTVVKYSATNITTALTGLPTIDGVVLSAGQAVLLVSEGVAANNGVWVVSSGPWTRSAVVPMTLHTVVTVDRGTLFSGTSWALTTVTPLTFTQIRLWKSTMWTSIAASRPTLKLSVDVNRDALLPPYVSASLPWSSNALTTTMPSNPSAAYTFGQNSPVETVWKKTVDYRYALARALFRSAPLSFLGNCWGFEWQEVDGILYDGFDMAMPGQPNFRLHGDTISDVTRTAPFTAGLITSTAAYTLTIKHDGYTAARRQAFSVYDQNGVFVTTLLEGVATSMSNAGFTFTNVKIEDEGKPFRVGDTFTVTGSANGTGLSAVLTQANYHQINGFGQTFTQALRASSIDTSAGYAIQAFRNFNVNLGYRAGGLVNTDDLRVYSESVELPSSSYQLRFKKSQYANDLWLQALRITVVQPGAATVQGDRYYPAGDASDWVFRIEGYNTRYLGLQYYPLGGEYSTFNALSKAHTTLAWKHHSDKLGTPISTQLPLIVTGLQNVVNILFGYALKLEEDGWVFNDPDASNIDEATGRVRNWQLEIEKLVDAVYTGLTFGQGHVCNPFIDKVWLQQPTGLLASFSDTSLFDVHAHPAVFDTLGVKLKTDDLTVLRQRGVSRISASVPMFSVHAQVDEYEHLFVFNDLSSPSTGEGTIYDPFSGARVVMLKLNGRRQGPGTMRPEFGGHYMSGDEVRKNFQAATQTISKYYDADAVFEDELSTRHALALLGFSPKQYMTDLDLNNNTQFNFWRGLIQMKGTNASIGAFLNNDRFEDAKIDEYWAYKVAEYGDSRSKIFPELKLTVDDTLQQFTKFLFDDAPAADFTSFVLIKSSDETRWFTLDDLSDTPVTFEAQVVGTYSADVSPATVYEAGLPAGVIRLPFLADVLNINKDIQTVVDVRAASVANVPPPISGALTIDGVALSIGDKVLLKNQTTLPGGSTANGIWVVSAGTWVRHADYDTIAEVNSTYVVRVNAGTQANSLWTRTLPLDPYTYTRLANVEVVNGNTLLVVNAGALDVVGYGPAAPKFNPVKLLNYVDAEMVEEIPIWHPAAGQHAPVAMESVNIVSTKDPARYNKSTLVTGNSNYDPLRMWGANEVGRVWFDTTSLEYLPYWDAKIYTTVDERLARWGTLTDYASVDVVEWVESTVAPSLYDAQAAIDAGNSDLDAHTRAEGTVYGAKTYQRERVWNVYPIFWSHAAVAAEEAHPQPLGSYDSNLFFTATTPVLAYLESKTFLQCGIGASARLGAWQDDVTQNIQRPLSEYVVLDGFTKHFEGIPTTTVNFTQSSYAPTSTLAAKVSLTATTHTETIGQLLFVFDSVDLIATQLRDADGLLTTAWDIATYVRVIVNGATEIFQVRNDRGTGSTSAAAIASATFATLAGQTFQFTIPAYGLQLTVTSQSAGTHNTTMLAAFIEAALSGSVTMFDAVTVEAVVNLDTTTLAEAGISIGASHGFSNTSDANGQIPDPLYTANSGVGWRAWSVPTQAQLDADSVVPNSSWLPYVGIPYSFTHAAVPIGIVQDAAAGASYSLNDGTTIERYSTTWSDWTELQQAMIRQTQTALGVPSMTIAVPIVSSDRVSVYVNGVAQLTGTYTLSGGTLTVLSVPYGHNVTVIIRAYSPSIKELAFDPAAKDDLLVQRQYKTDYQYVEIPVRDSAGALSLTKYYFWVKNRATAAPKNNLSVKAVTQLLTSGPSQYLTFQSINSSAPFAYSGVAIAGLNYLVTKDNTFKLRFTRNFTLRDDPNQLDLKDTHVEWSLIRPGQRTKIPEALWLKLTNTACGQDPAGNTLPSPRRTAYDERNGTKTQFGFADDQVLAPPEMVQVTLLSTILNTRLVDDSGVVTIPDYIGFLDFDQYLTWFDTPAHTRNTLTRIWNEAKVSQINELFFAVLEDIVAANYELSDVFKTSRLSAYSIKIVRPSTNATVYE
jgi:hypothetical protein